ncbi:5-deoxy-glucuronate isomerase [Bacillus niacini]|jgi:5-deoxy-glucuronate isomerase|uniref:5-deoxy-glucuronate isomerase n=1 Tax=Neobacillus niacini TaxID=86668 RepID=A0A852T8V5_9BACI|nr:5-deoxy-glucuronate isomerase [Neobacillus niacini]NYE04236.1 5-deoxy-glucuronate isomerase [Neobacillus niacini]
MQKKLLYKSIKSEQPSLVRVMPEESGLQFVGFEACKIQKGETIKREAKENEICAVILSGKVKITTKELTFDDIGNRLDIFEKIPPYALYVTKDDCCEMEALTEVVEIAFCSSPSAGSYPTRVIKPADVEVIERGKGNMKRYVHNILPEDREADSLLVVEVFTPEGNWSSYPPHKHDVLNLPVETLLEETYYHRMKPDKGFAFQRVYTDDQSIDAAFAIKDGDVVVVPKGYHPVAASPGHELYYLNVMAGPTRLWRFHNDKDLEWLLNK